MNNVSAGVFFFFFFFFFLNRTPILGGGELVPYYPLDWRDASPGLTPTCVSFAPTPLVGTHDSRFTPPRHVYELLFLLKGKACVM